MFTYLSSALLDPQSGWWVVAYIEFAAKAVEFLLVEVYGSCQLWVLSAERNRNIPRLYLVRVLGSRANAEGLERLFCVIKLLNFATCPDDWPCHGEGRSLARWPSWVWG